MFACLPACAWASTQAPARTRRQVAETSLSKGKPPAPLPPSAHAMSKTAQSTSNAIPLKGSVDIVTEFFGASGPDSPGCALILLLMSVLTLRTSWPLTRPFHATHRLQHQQVGRLTHCRAPVLGCQPLCAERGVLCRFARTLGAVLTTYSCCCLRRVLMCYLLRPRTAAKHTVPGV